MEKPIQKMIPDPMPEENLLQMLLDQKKELIKAVRAGKPVSSVPAIGEMIQRKKWLNDTRFMLKAAGC